MSVFPDEGILLVDKPYLWTSFDVVNKVRWLFKGITGKRIKVGHAGTLDPLATGLLLVCFGKATKNIDEIQQQKKTYNAHFFLGATTPSFDGETNIDSWYPTSHLDKNLITETIDSFTTTYNQIPPAFSAAQQSGKRLYELARAGKELIPEAKPVTIYNMELVTLDLPLLELNITCSKGTYIRSLANDMGKAMKTGACLSYLRRTNIGDFSVENAISINNLDVILKANPTEILNNVNLSWII